MIDMINMLSENSQVSAWRVTEKAIRSYELFFVHKQLETVRATDTVDTSVTVYVDHDGKRGDSTFSVYRSMSEADIAARIDSAVRRARLVFNEPYELPAGGELDVDLPSNMREEDARQLGCRIADAVFAADQMAGGSINACEIFLYQDTLHVRNSRGVDKTQRVCRVMIEAIPTFTTAQQSVELYEDYRFTDFDPAAVTAEITARMREVRDRSRAIKPQTPMTVDVALRPMEIRELMCCLAEDADYANVYRHGNLHKIGDDLQAGGAGDKLTFSLVSVLPGCDKSARFDADGCALRDTCILDRGVVANYYGDSRYGQYLGIQEPSGDLPFCVSAEPGTLQRDVMNEAPYLECVSMSGLQVDLYNDYIGGEIRLAYLHEGDMVTPVTGITMSARLSEVLSSLRLSTRVVREGAYHGPDRLLMRGVQVL